jgi:hypothetical protein
VQQVGSYLGYTGLAAKPFADLDAKWAGNERDSVNFIRMAHDSFKRS